MSRDGPSGGPFGLGKEFITTIPLSGWSLRNPWTQVVVQRGPNVGLSGSEAGNHVARDLELGKEYEEDYNEEEEEVPWWEWKWREWKEWNG